MSITKKLSAMPCTLGIAAIWIAIWLVITCSDITPILCGKGIAKIGNAYYRIVTAGLTHKHILHVLANASALFWIGYLYEQHIGSIPFAITGILCAIAAQALFLCIYRNADSSIGGSVYTFSFLGFGLCAQCFIPDFPKITLGTCSGNWLAIYAIGSNLPIFLAADAATIVIHAIALALGAIAGVVYWLWDKSKS